MPVIDRVLIYERRYYHELNRREELNRRVSLPLGIIILLFGTFPSYFVPAIIKLENSEEKVVTLFFIVIMAGSLITSTIFLIKTYLWQSITSKESYNFIDIPLPDEIEEYLDKDDDGSEFTGIMIDSYAAAVRVNFEQNNIKEYYLYKGVEWIIYALCAGGVSLVILNYRIF